MFIIVPPDTIMKVPYNRHNQSTPTTDTKKKITTNFEFPPPIGLHHSRYLVTSKNVKQ